MKKKIGKLIPSSVKEILRKKRNTPKFTRSITGSEDLLNGMIAYNEYGGYLTPINSQQRPAVQKILKGQVYEPDTIQFMREHCKAGDVIHAGTFFGDFLPGLSSAMAVDAKIWAFEPNIENFRCAQITMQLNNLKNIALFNCGLGEIKTRSKMLIETAAGDHLGGASIILKEDQSTGRTIDVAINCIDDIIPEDRAISIIQLDVEGYEKEALSGGLKTIKRCKPLLILEDNDNIIESTWFDQNIRKLGYAVVRKIHGNTLLRIN